MTLLRSVILGTLAVLAAVVDNAEARTGGTGFSTSWTGRQVREQAAKRSLSSTRGGGAHSYSHGSVGARDIDPSLLYPAYNLSTPVDHFHNETAYAPHTNATFGQRYWFDASHYRPGGPVIVLQSGEDSGVDRLPYLQKGILAQLAEATGGVGVVLEHRYYGTSFPPLPDLSAHSLRFLTTEQALADMAYFAQNVAFPGLEHLDLTAPGGTPYIAYGGSYAGAFVAILRVLYPELYWGAVSSSGVTEAIVDYWQYYEAARLFGPPAAITATQKLTSVVDNILIGLPGTDYPARLKAAFGLGNITRSDDFANALTGGISGLQNTDWDPAVDDPSYYWYCGNVSSTRVLYPGTAGLAGEVGELIEAGGWGAEADVLVPQMLNYIGWVNATEVQPWLESGESADDYFGNFNAAFYAQDDLSQTWRSWPYQYCTQWGYLQTGSGVPATQLPLISRLINLNYTSYICDAAFGITSPPDINSINKYGGFGISYPRLAIIGGLKDPWRDATPLAVSLPLRPSTPSEPVFLISDGVHHWDENGLFANETTPTLPPAPVAAAQADEREFVATWVKEYQEEKKKKRRGADSQ